MGKLDGDSKLAVTYDVASHALSGDLTGTFDSSDALATVDTDEVTVTLYVTSVPQCAALGAAVAEAKYKDEDKTNCGKRPVAHICTISDLDAKINALKQLWYVFVIAGVVLILCCAGIVALVCRSK